MHILQTCRSRVSAATFLCLISFVSLAPAPGSAQPAGEEQPGDPDDHRHPVQLPPVVVTAPRIASEAARVPAAVSVVEGDTVRQGRPHVMFNDALARIPGVFAQNEHNFAQDLRLSIRGFGARSAFGIRGIRILVDGIPYTLPDGQSTFDSIDPDTVQRVEVMRGPASALYGNASGGVVNIVTRDGPPDPFVSVRGVIGEFGLRKTVLSGGGRTGRVNAYAALSQLTSDGYRDHSEAEKNVFNSKLRYDIDDGSDLTLILNDLETPEARDPGGLTAEQVDADPSAAAGLNLGFDTREKVSDQRIGLIYRREPAPGHHIETAVYAHQRDLENAIPFRFIELDRRGFGGRVQYDTSGGMLGVNHRLVSGVDLQYQDDDRVNFDNIGGRPGDELLLAQDESVTALGVYLQDDVEPAPGWSVVLGGRYDYVRFDIEDRLTADGDDSGDRIFDRFTGRLGMLYALSPAVKLYGNIAQSFETPTTTEVVNRPQGGGGINPDIAPQTAVNYEVGIKTAFSGGLSLDAALFHIDLDDELIAFRDATDRVFYRNAGESRRWGAELGMTKTFSPQWRLLLAYTYLSAEFDTYVKDDIDLGGNAVPGLPEHGFFAELRYSHASGLYAAGSLRYIGEFYADDENTLTSDDAAVIDVLLGCEKKLAPWTIEPFVGVRNLLDETYSSNVRINATGGRYFEPAPGRNFYGGLSISYQWL